MREKYESLSLATLKDLAKARGLKGISTLRKPELIERMLREDELENTSKAQETVQEKPQEEVWGNAAEKPQENVQGAVAERAQESAAERPRQYGRPLKYNRPQQYGRGQERQTERTQDRSQERQTERTQDRSQERQAERVQDRSQERQMEHVQDRNQEHQTENMQDRVQDYQADRTQERPQYHAPAETVQQLDSGERADGILEVLPDGYGFIRCENYLPGENDIYVSPSQIRRFNLKTGDIIKGNIRIKTQGEKFSALLYVASVNDEDPAVIAARKSFEELTPIFPNERIELDGDGAPIPIRMINLLAPIGKGQRGMIVSPPKTGKTTLLKQIAKQISRRYEDMHLLVLLIDERPEEVTDIRESIEGPNVEVIYSTFDELPEHHKRVSEMVIERAKRLVEHKKDVVILLDSITRLTRAYNLVVPPSGRTLSGGLDPAALHMPKRFFGAARNMREGGSLTILATALVETGSKMDDVVYEEFKGTGNMEMVLDRRLSEKRIFPAIDLAKSGTRREDLLLNSEELEAINIMRKALNGLKPDEATDRILDMFARTRNNAEFVGMVKKNKFI